MNNNDPRSVMFYHFHELLNKFVFGKHTLKQLFRAISKRLDRNLTSLEMKTLADPFEKHIRSRSNLRNFFQQYNLEFYLKEIASIPVEPNYINLGYQFMYNHYTPEKTIPEFYQFIENGLERELTPFEKRIITPVFVPNKWMLEHYQKNVVI